MGTVAQKLQSALDSKEAIKQALQNKGENPTNVFSTYAGIINNMTKVEFADPKERKEEWTYAGHVGPIRSIAVDRQGNTYTAGGYQDNTVKKIDPKGNLLWNFTGHTNSVLAVAVDVDYNVYSGGEDNTVKKIDPTGTELWSFPHTGGSVKGIAVDPLTQSVYAVGGTLLVKLNPDGTKAWEKDTGNSMLNTVATDNYGNAYACSGDVKKYRPNGTLASTLMYGDSIFAIAIDGNQNIVIGGYDKKIVKYNDKMVQQWIYSGHTNFVYALAVDELGNVYSGSQDRTVRKIDPTGTELWKFTGHTGIIYGLKLDSEGCIHTGCSDKTAKKIFQRTGVAGTFYAVPELGQKPVPVSMSIDPTQPVTYMLQDASGQETYAQKTSETPVTLTATPNDVRLGTRAVTGKGVIDGSKDIPSYHTTTGVKGIRANEKFIIPLADREAYNYTELQAMTMPYNTSMENSVAVDRAVIADKVYPTGQTTPLANVTKDIANKSISLGITNGNEPAVIRYFTYKEEA